MDINKSVTKTSSLESTQVQFCTVLSSQERPLPLLTWQNSSVNEKIWCLNATFRMLCPPLPQHYTLLELQQEQRWVFPARLSSHPAPWDLFYLQTSGCQTPGVCWTQGWRVTHYNRANTQPVVFSVTVQSAQLIHSVLLMCIYIYDCVQWKCDKIWIIFVPILSQSFVPIYVFIIRNQIHCKCLLLHSFHTHIYL